MTVYSNLRGGTLVCHIIFATAHSILNTSDIDRRILSCYSFFAISCYLLIVLCCIMS